MLKLARIYYPAMGYEGEGMACVIYFQGCHNRCDGCHNPTLQLFEDGEKYSPSQLFKQIVISVNIDWVDSYVFSGGEPLHQDNQDIIKLARLLGDGTRKPIWLYTSELFVNISDDIKSVFDVIVDGSFKKELHEKNLKYRGSKNQRVWRKIADVRGGQSMWEEMIC